MNNTLSEKNSTVSVIKILFISSLFLTVIQQLPIIKVFFYSEIRIVLYIILFIVALFSLSKFNMAIQSFHFLFLTSVVISNTLFYVVFFINDVNVSFTELLVPYSILLISITMNFTKKTLNYILLFYISLALIMGMSNVLYYTGGFQISALYTVPFKNQLGPILGSSIIILSFWLIQRSKNLLSYKLYFLIALLGLFFSLFVIRNRATILAVFIVLILMFMFNFLNQFNIKRILILISSIIIFFVFTILGYTNIVFQYIWESFTLNYNIEDLNSLSAGRTDVYNDSLIYIMSNIFLGEVTSTVEFYSTAHNFLLNKLISFGIIGALPTIMYYFYLIYFTVSGLLKYGKKADIIFWLMLFSLIVSQFEYTYPFGPGVSQIILWFILGQFLRNKLNKNQSISI